MAGGRGAACKQLHNLAHTHEKYLSVGTVIRIAIDNTTLNQDILYAAITGAHCVQATAAIRGNRACNMSG